MTTTTWQVEGMTCGHCVASVTEEVAAIPGVTAVDVILETGAVSVVSTGTLDREAIAAAVEEAGYRLT